MQRFTSLPLARAAVAAVLGITLSLVATVLVASRTTARTNARLDSAATRLDSLTGTPSDDPGVAAIAWGYAERLRLGLESPFRLVEAASRDVRLPSAERRTVAWALLARIAHGEAARVDPAALDGIGPRTSASVTGEQHLALIRATIAEADDPRVAELALRLAYTLAVAERVVEPAAPVLVAQAAALVSDAEIARREAVAIIRGVGGHDPVEEVVRRRVRRMTYVERPVLLAAPRAVEDAAIARVPDLLHAIRTPRPVPPSDSTEPEADDRMLVRELYAAGERALPAAPLVVTVRRYLPALTRDARAGALEPLARVRNAEMLVAATAARPARPAERPAVARLLLAAGAAMRSLAQDPVWVPSDSMLPADAAAAAGVASIRFDRDVPTAWRAFYVRTFVDAIRDVRLVFPAVALQQLHVRFRMTAPADSALAMHDPRTRTLHLPVLTAGGTLSHELAHDLDRQSAAGRGLVGYRSDLAARGQGGMHGGGGRVAASLRALTEELAQAPSSAPSGADRPAEIFATRVDWFVASSLARIGRTDGYLSAVEDELLTGHVVHPERLRVAARTQPLLDALEGMTAVAPFAASESDPSAQTLLRWSLAAPLDRGIAGDIVARGQAAEGAVLLGARSCDRELSPDAALIRMAAESRARGWLRLRAHWQATSERKAWAQAALGGGPWTPELVDVRAARLRDYILVSLASSSDLPAGLTAFAAPLAATALCGD